MCKLAWLRATYTELETMRAHSGDRWVLWLRAGPERLNVYGFVVFAGRKAEVVNRICTILHGFADFNRALDIGPSASNVLYAPSSRSFPKETLEQLQKFMHGTFLKECVASTVRERRMWSVAVNQ